MSNPAAPFRLIDPRLLPIAEKIAAGIRLDREDAITLATTDDLLGVGHLANQRRESLHGTSAFFNINRHLNPTNVCAASCRLCAFYVPWRERHRGWTWTVEQAVATVARDLDGTIIDERVTRAAGGAAGAGMSRDRLERLIREAGRTPVLRDTLYRPVEPSKPSASSSLG